MTANLSDALRRPNPGHAAIVRLETFDISQQLLWQSEERVRSHERRDGRGRGGTRAPDKTDLSILSLLQENARITNAALAQRICLTAPPCLRRVQELERLGFIRRYRARLNAKKLGFGACGFVTVSLDRQSANAIVAFEEVVRSRPEVRACHALSGELDFLLDCVARTHGDLQAFVDKVVRRAPHVRGVKLLIVARESKSAPGVPI